MRIYKNQFWVGRRRMFFNSTGAVMRSLNANEVFEREPRQYASAKLMEVLENLSATKRSNQTIESANRKFRVLWKQAMFPIRAYQDQLWMGCQSFSWPDIKKLMAMRRRAMK